MFGDQLLFKVVVFDDGWVLYVWIDYVLIDGFLSVCVNGWILNLDGILVIDVFVIGILLIDGYDYYDVDNFDVIMLVDGNVVVGYVCSMVEVGYDIFVMLIIDLIFVFIDFNFMVVIDVVMV